VRIFCPCLSRSPAQRLAALFKDAPAGAFPLTAVFDRAAEAERLCGLRLEGVWMHVGTPEAA
jgi:N-acetyl-alpha-D-muramate 1-phosphate uridylyltransferase